MHASIINLGTLISEKPVTFQGSNYIKEEGKACTFYEALHQEFYYFEKKIIISIFPIRPIAFELDELTNICHVQSLFKKFIKRKSYYIEINKFTSLNPFLRR